ncbi:MAG: FtsH protease activity modulator HflK [Legionellales bacterium]|jgi:membrane protease subunit HflK|nr:FtsH protease activity modulator HflK [Legionellales bacterium]|tara:strand:+ start:30 stop:1169 length:1140 start_codon:yes stop_codon:yes gene_type:complete
MSWNEPPDGNKNKDPWGKNGSNGGPPDLDEIVRRMQRGFGGIFGKKPSKGGGSIFPFSVVIILLIAWLVFDMTYLVDQQQRGVVLRFGKYVTTLDPGLNIRLPRPIEKVTKVNVGQVRSITHKASMLTQDENIVDVEVAVQWRIGTATDFLFNVFDPFPTLRQVTESAVREVIGKSELDFVLTEGRSEIAQKIQILIQDVLDDYESGIYISSVEMQPAKPPEEVKAAFDDAIKAREDEQRLVNEAEAYRNDIIPKARGAAARLREESNGYKARVIAKAEGEASRFEQLLIEYQRAPKVTRERLYLDAIESVFSNTNKVLIDNDNGNSLMYLPIDRLIDNNTNKKPSTSNSTFNNLLENQTPSSTNNLQNNLNSRLRGSR